MKALLEELRLASHRSRPVALPAPVASRLCLTAPFDNTAALGAALDWFARRGEADFCSDPTREVIYQAFLGPFLGFEGELGTLESLICFLPFIIEDLKASNVILLPLLERGITRSKGLAGSPFAVADHSRLSQGMSGFGDGISVEHVWKAIVDAVRSVGVRMGMIVPLATVAIDSKHILEAPSLVYWWQAKPNEILTGEFKTTRERPFGSEAVPASDVLHRFSDAPQSRDIEVIVENGQKFFISYDCNGKTLSVANAYPDPIVGDMATYAWSDVAAIRFDAAIVPHEYGSRPWTDERVTINKAAEDLVIRAFSERMSMGEAVLLADVSAALPSGLLQRVVPQYPEALVVAEQLWCFTERAPFEFILGPLIPCVAAHWADPCTISESLVYHLKLLDKTADCKWFMAGVANHDTIPCPPLWSRALLALFSILPKSVPFLYSGTEFACDIPTNLEFYSLPEGYIRPSEAELLLFSERPLTRDITKMADFVPFWSEVLHFREIILNIKSNQTNHSLRNIERREGIVSGWIGEVYFIINFGPDFYLPKSELTERAPGYLVLSTNPVIFSGEAVRIVRGALVYLVPDSEPVRKFAAVANSFFRHES